jgi:hypothetical protein
MQLGWERGEACTEFWWGNLRDRDHWEDQGIDGRIILRWIFRKWDMGVWTGLGLRRIETRDVVRMHQVTRHNTPHPQYSIDCSSIEHLSEGTINAP